MMEMLLSDYEGQMTQNILGLDSSLGVWSGKRTKWLENLQTLGYFVCQIQGRPRKTIYWQQSNKYWNSIDDNGMKVWRVHFGDCVFDMTSNLHQSIRWMSILIHGSRFSPSVLWRQSSGVRWKFGVWFGLYDRIDFNGTSFTCALKLYEIEE